MEATVCLRARRCSISPLLLWALGQVGYGLSADAADCAAVYCGYYEPDGPCVAEAMSRDSMEVQLVVGARCCCVHRSGPRATAVLDADGVGPTRP